MDDLFNFTRFDIIAQTKDGGLRNYELKAETNEILIKWVECIKFCQENANAKLCIIIKYYELFYDFNIIK